MVKKLNGRHNKAAVCGSPSKKAAVCRSPSKKKAAVCGRVFSSQEVTATEKK
jgi:hypothetical protein